MFIVTTMLPEETSSTSPAPSTGRLGRWWALMGKYGLSSLTATAADFMTFHLALSVLLLQAVPATVLGRSVGAVVAFLLQRKWVFRNGDATRKRFIAVKYSAGVFLGMAFNVFGVWVLAALGGWAPWPARVVSAVLGWFLIFWFNKQVVFRHRAVGHSSRTFRRPKDF